MGTFWTPEKQEILYFWCRDFREMCRNIGVIFFLTTPKRSMHVKHYSIYILRFTWLGSNWSQMTTRDEFSEPNNLAEKKTGTLCFSHILWHMTGLNVNHRTNWGKKQSCKERKWQMFSVMNNQNKGQIAVKNVYVNPISLSVTGQFYIIKIKDPSFSSPLAQENRFWFVESHVNWPHVHMVCKPAFINFSATWIQLMWWELDTTIRTKQVITNDKHIARIVSQNTLRTNKIYRPLCFPLFSK